MTSRIVGGSKKRGGKIALGNKFGAGSTGGGSTGGKIALGNTFGAGSTGGGSTGGASTGGASTGGHLTAGKLTEATKMKILQHLQGQGFFNADLTSGKVGGNVHLKDTFGGALGLKHDHANLSDADKMRILKHLHGQGFFSDLWGKVKHWVKPIATVAKHVLPIIAPGWGSVASTALGALGAGMPPETERKPARKPKRQASAATLERAKIVKQVMAEQGLSLPQASSYVKANNLY